MANGGLNIEANVESGDYQLISALDWTMNHTYLFLSNSAANSTANLTIDIGRLLFVSGTNDQCQTLTFGQGKFTVNGTGVSSFTAAGAGVARLEVFTGTDVTWNGRLTMGANSVYDLYGKVTHTQGFTFEKGSTLNINEGAHLYKATSGTLYLNGTVNVASNAKLETVAGSKTELGGTLNTASDMKFFALVSNGGVYNQTAGSTTLTRTTTLSNGADWTIYEKLTLEGGDNTGSKTAELTINDDVNFVIKNNENGKYGNRARILLNGYNHLVLNKENAIVDENGNAVSIATIGNEKKTIECNKITINADQTFNTLYLGANSSLEITMANDVMLSFVGENSFNTADDSAYLFIYNFQENTIQFNNSNTAVCEKIESYIKLYGATAEDFLGFAKINENGFLTLAIPEPAEWAMIFGALALGLAVYRRRK